MTTESICESVKRSASLPAIRSILESISRQTTMGFCAVAIITGNRWVLAAIHDVIGLDLHPGYAIASEMTICHDVCMRDRPVIIDQVSRDLHYANHQMPLQFDFQSYISFPIRLNTDDITGTLLAIDKRPVTFNTGQIQEMFSIYADLVAFYLRSEDIINTEELCGTKKAGNSELRELHVAMLGHDLRNPLTAISNAAKIIAQRSDDDKILDLVQIVQSSSHRMAAMVNNIMRFSRSHVGREWQADIRPETGLQEKLEQTIAEHLINSRGRIIQSDYDLPAPVNCDGTMILQVAANLLTNALIHGCPESPIRFRAYNNKGNFILSVTNSGTPIPDSELTRIFQPFAQIGDGKGRRKGLGLGLHIISEIAAAHRGTVSVESYEYSTTVSFIIPVS